jgi:hypothetical protein
MNARGQPSADECNFFDAFENRAAHQWAAFFVRTHLLFGGGHGSTEDLIQWCPLSLIFD